MSELSKSPAEIAAITAMANVIHADGGHENPAFQSSVKALDLSESDAQALYEAMLACISAKGNQ